MPARLSVNVNKIATLRNSRGGTVPDLVEATRVILDAGATGITVHPRSDERHIRLSDVRELSELLAPVRERVEFNIEGDPREALMDLVCTVRPHQCTLVPVRPGELTSEAGWDPMQDHAHLERVVRRLQAASVRVSLFVNPEASAIRWAADLGADRVELYTEPYAASYARGEGSASYASYVAASELAHSLGLGVNAGHDLDLRNLPLFRELPHLDEVSIGHALIAHALYVGLAPAVRDYLACLRGEGSGSV
jgi:pyridoxine 5-phosphate synthase